MIMDPTMDQRKSSQIGQEIIRGVESAKELLAEKILEAPYNVAVIIQTKKEGDRALEIYHTLPGGLIADFLLHALHNCLDEILDQEKGEDDDQLQDG